MAVTDLMGRGEKKIEGEEGDGVTSSGGDTAKQGERIKGGLSFSKGISLVN